MFVKRRLPSFQRCLGKHYMVFPSRERAMGIQRSVSYLRVFWSTACKKWMILHLLNKLSGKNEPQKLFPKTSFVRRIYSLIDSGWDIDGIFSVYTAWADIATGSVISLGKQIIVMVCEQMRQRLHMGRKCPLLILPLVKRLKQSSRLTTLS